jgi:DNA invertase Pin-like site-specific DNA recombinase
MPWEPLLLFSTSSAPACHVILPTGVPHLAKTLPMPMMIVMKTCILYARVSTDKQEVSIDAQLTKGREWARLHGMSVLSEYTDVASGAKDSRQGMDAAVKRACSEHATLVCYSLSRLSRSTIRCIELITQLSKCGSKFISLTDGELETVSPQGEFMVTIYASVAQLERRLIGQRTACALRHLRSQGRNIYSKVPFGWDVVGKRLVKNEAEHDIIAGLIAQRRDGASLGEIAASLNSSGIPTKQGKRWGRGTLYALLTREMGSKTRAA